LKVRGAVVSKDNPVFRETVLEILTSETSRIGSRSHQAKVQQVLNNSIDLYC